MTFANIHHYYFSKQVLVQLVEKIRFDPYPDSNVHRLLYESYSKLSLH